MRKFKRLASLALAAVMTLGMCAPAFATGTGDPGEGTPTPEYTTETYDVYQIFTGTVDGDILGHILWGADSKASKRNGAEVGAQVDDATLAELKTVQESTDNQTKLAKIKEYVEMSMKDGVPAKKVTVEGKAALQFTVEKPGYYLIKNHNVPTDNVATTYIVKVTGEILTVFPKTSKPTVDKKVEVGSDNKQINQASIGDVLTFTLTGTLPSNFEDFKTYSYVFTDTMSKGLKYGTEIKDGETVTYGAIKSITINGQDVELTSNIYTSNSNPNTEDSTKTDLTITFSDLRNSEWASYFANVGDMKIIVKYTATLTEEASMGLNPNENTVKLTYSNDPNSTGDGEPSTGTTDTTVDGETVKTETYVTGLTVTDFAADKPMTGAVFELSGAGINKILTVGNRFDRDDEKGTYYKLNTGDNVYTAEAPNGNADHDKVYESTTEKYKLTQVFENTDKSVVTGETIGEKKKVNATIGVDGTLTIAGLGIGEYTLHQVSAPNGYNVHDDITWTIAFTDSDKKFNSNNNDVRCDGSWFYIDLVQNRGTLLPETGGVGTTMMYIGGMLLIAMAGATIILKGKKAEDAE